MQSKKHSAFEAVQNIVVGIGIAYLANAFILPQVLGIKLHVSDNMIITAFFTVISFIRSYCLRRFNNWIIHREKRPVVRDTEELIIQYQLGRFLD